MDNVLASLRNNMDKQLMLYKKLLSLSQEKQPVLINGDMKELARITKEEELLVLQVGKLEEQRNSLHQVLANHFNIPKSELTSEQLIKCTDEKTGADLKLIVTEISKVIRKLSETNKTNGELIKSSLKYINFSLNLLTSDSIKPSYRGSDDDKRGNAAAKIFDRMI